jgi:hypothetical protein
VIKRVELERRRWREAYPAEFSDGLRIAFFGEAKAERDPAGGGYPHGFHQWSIDRRNAWFCGFNLGYVRRKKQTEQEVDRLAPSGRPAAPCDRAGAQAR